MIIDKAYGGRISQCDRCKVILVHREDRWEFYEESIMTGDNFTSTSKLKRTGHWHLCNKCRKAFRKEFLGGKHE